MIYFKLKNKIRTSASSYVVCVCVRACVCVCVCVQSQGYLSLFNLNVAWLQYLSACWQANKYICSFILLFVYLAYFFLNLLIY